MPRKQCLYICLALLVVLSCDTIDEVETNVLTLPIIHLEIDPYYLYSPDSGLFVIGENGNTWDWAGHTANYLNGWEHPARISFDIDNDIVVNEKIGFRIKANSGRLRPNKTLGLYWREEYGQKRLEDASNIFPKNGTNRYKRLKLDAGSEISHNIIVETIVRGKANIEVAYMRPINLYINDRYWGLYNLRETLTPHHFEYHYGVNDDAVNILTRSFEQPGIDDGSKDEWLKNVYQISKSLDFTKDESLVQIGEHLDLESVIDYYAIQTYIYNWDWPLNNTKWWNDPTSTEHQKWKFIFTDIDKACNLDYVNHLWLGNFHKEKEPPRLDYESGFDIFNTLMENKAFRKSFFKRYLEIIDDIFDQNRVETIVEKQISEIKNDYRFHYKKWGELPPRQWESKLREISEFNSKRRGWLKPIIQDFYKNEIANEN